MDDLAQDIDHRLFILFGFASSNALQRKRNLAIGWALLGVADFISLMWAQFWSQITALVIGLAGLGFLIAGFYQRYKEDQAKK